MESPARFLPSLVYSRWKWAVRGGLLLVPFLTFLNGGLLLYLSPTLYRSTAVVEFQNAPAPPELAELLASRAVLTAVSEQLELVKSLNLNRDTTVDLLRQITEVEIVPETHLLEISVTYRQRDSARDIAAQLVRSLRDHLTGIVKTTGEAKANDLKRLILQAREFAEQEASKMVNLERLHGPEPAAAAVATTLQRARRASLLADAEVERLFTLLNECVAQTVEAAPRLIVHSDPVASQIPHSPQVGAEFSKLIGRSLLFGLLTALLMPYLLELVFPPRAKRPDQPTSPASGTAAARAATLAQASDHFDSDHAIGQ